MSRIPAPAAPEPVVCLSPVREITIVLCEWCGKRFAQVPPAGFFWLHAADDDCFPVCAVCANANPIGTRLLGYPG